MSGTLNKVMLIGHLGDDVKMHYFENGGCIGNVTIATNNKFTNKQTGEKVSETEWHNLVFRNKSAEVMEKYTTKGDKIYVEGRLKTRKYESEGTTRYTTEVNVNEFTFLSTKKSNNTTVNDPQTVVTEQDDDLPFN